MSSTTVAGVRSAMRPGVVAVLVLGLVRVALAHPLAPCVLELRETPGGVVEVGWKTPLVRARGAELEPVLPARCRPLRTPKPEVEGGGVWRRWTVDCGRDGLVGQRVGVTGPGTVVLAAVVRVTLADGRLVQGVTSPGRPLVTIPPRPRALDVARDYARLGVAHILTGPDHLLFVLGLVLLAGTARRVVATVTAFTFGHSITLTLAALGLIVVPSRPIEVAIATTVLAVAVELARPRAASSLARRRPWLMAATFGLLHGLGFAAALREAGLPAGEVPLALLSFNVGIEAGQVGFVLGVLALRRAVHGFAADVPGWLRQIPVYGMGTLAGYWWLDRLLALIR